MNNNIRDNKEKLPENIDFNFIISDKNDFGFSIEIPKEYK
jgi:hypothetical protein